MYVATCTRPDIAYAVGEVAKFCERYNKSHWVAANRILKYLITTQDLGILFRGKNKGEIIGFADANWAGDLDTRRSTTGYNYFPKRQRDIMEIQALTNSGDIEY